MAITKRLVKGSKLTHSELDANFSTLETTGAGEFTGQFDLSLGNKIYDAKISGAVVNLSVSSTRQLGAVGRVEILGEYVGTVPETWRIIGDAISTTTGDRNILMVCAVSDTLVELVNTMIPVGGVDTTAPTIQSATITDANPDKLVVVFDENVVITDTTGLTVTGGAGYTISSVTGSGTNSLTFTLNSAVASGESLTFNYDGTNNIQDESGNGLVTGSTSITNNVAGAPTTYVDWVQLNGAAEGVDGTINLSGASADLANGAYSKRKISGNNAVSFTVPAASANAKQGIGFGETGANFDSWIDIDTYNRLSLFAYVDNTSNTLKVFESGSQVYSQAVYQTSDVITVRMNGGVGSVERNGTAVFTSAVDYTGKEFHVLSILHGSFASSQVFNAEFETTVGLFEFAPAENIVWTDLLNVADNGGSGSLIGVVGSETANWENGAIASKALNGDNSVYYRLSGVPNVRESIGLTNTYAGITTDAFDMDIWIKTHSTQDELEIWEDGVQQTVSDQANNSITSETVIELKLVGTTVSVLVNGSIIYTSGKTFTKPLNVVALLHGSDFTTNQILESGFKTTSNLIAKTI